MTELVCSKKLKVSKILFIPFSNRKLQIGRAIICLQGRGKLNDRNHKYCCIKIIFIINSLQIRGNLHTMFIYLTQCLGYLL